MGMWNRQFPRMCPPEAPSSVWWGFFPQNDGKSRSLTVMPSAADDPNWIKLPEKARPQAAQQMTDPELKKSILEMIETLAIRAEQKLQEGSKP
jgi:hypothetical protein